MEKHLKEVSDKTISEVLHDDVVLPSHYQETFEKNAKSFGLDISLEELAKNLIDEDYQKAQFMIDAANNHLSTLHSKATDATDAIAKKDDKRLGEITTDINKMKEEIASLRQQLYTDSLTKVKNRKWMGEHYIDEEGLFTKSGAMVFMDLNNFKHINDTYGHIVGDKVLIFFAGFFLKTVGNEGYHIVRYAGDEFIAFKETNINEAQIVEKFEILQKTMMKKKLKAPAGEILTVSFSYGLCSFKEGDNFREILEIADKKMYENKQKIKESLKKV